MVIYLVIGIIEYEESQVLYAFKSMDDAINKCNELKASSDKFVYNTFEVEEIELT